MALEPAWSTTDTGTGTATTAMIPIDTHSLFTSISGPRRDSLHDPIVVIIAGAGDVASSYVALERLLASFTPLLLYDRSGLGRSESIPNPHHPSSAVHAATELHTLLQTAGVHPPFLLVGHSYGAIVAREFLHVYPAAVAGMVLCEAATERQSLYFRVPDPDIAAVLGDLNFARVTGLRAAAKLSREEWRTRAIDIARGHEAAAAEAGSFEEVCRTLGGKEQYMAQALGEKPLSVIRANSARDYERIYQQGVEGGNGTEEQRRAFRGLLDRWEEVDREMKEEQLRLSSRSRLVHLPDCGHNVHLVRPDVVAEEIRWVREMILGGDEGIKVSGWNEDPGVFTG